MNADKPLLAAVIQKVRDRLDKENKSIADLARAIGRPNNYWQVYAWVMEGKPAPGGEYALRLEAWANGDTAKLEQSLSVNHQTPKRAASHAKGKSNKAAR